MPGDVAAVVGDEGPGVMVLGKEGFALGPTGECRTLASGNGQLQNNFVTRPAGTRRTACRTRTTRARPPNALWLPNARIDGFSLIGASNAPGVLVNGYAHYLEVSNNKIFTNSGTFAGGIQVGHAGAAAPFSDENAQNDYVAIHNNMVTAERRQRDGRRRWRRARHRARRATW